MVVTTCSVYRGEHVVTTMQLVMMISPSNPPPSSATFPPQASPSQLPTTPQLGRFLRAPRPKTFTEVGATPTPANPLGRTVPNRHQPPQATPHLPQPLHPPHSRYPHSLPTHHTFPGVYSPGEDLKTPSYPLRPSNKCPPNPWSLLSSHQHVVLPGACQVLVAAVA